MARIPDYVKVETRQDGSKRYIVRPEITLANGARKQQKRTFRKLDEAVEYYSTVTADRARGLLIAPNRLTVRAVVDEWLDMKGSRSPKGKGMGGDYARRRAVFPIVEMYGDRPVQSIEQRDVEALIAALRDGTTSRGVWSVGYINVMLAKWKAIWKWLHARKKITHDEVSLVEPLPPEKPRKKSDPLMNVEAVLIEEEIEKLIALHAPRPIPDDVRGHARTSLAVRYRRELFLHLSLLGLRRAELAGLRWSRLDLDADTPTITVQDTRVVVTGVGIVDQEDDAKTATSLRTLELPPHVIPIARRHREEMRTNRLALGSAWNGDPDPHLFAHPDGPPLSPRTLTDWWNKSLDQAGIPHRRLQDSRHTCATLLHLRGAPPAMIAAWLGHADGGILAMRTYTHITRESLAHAASLLDRSPRPDTQPDTESGVEDASAEVAG